MTGGASPHLAILLGLICCTGAECAENVRIRIVAGNLTSGNRQNYNEGHGIRIFKGLKPDIALVQEFNFKDNTESAIRTFVNAAFGHSFFFHREKQAQIPNGIVSRWQIKEQGVWDDTEAPNREFVWARIDIPGPVDLWVFSLHLLTDTNRRPLEARQLVRLIRSKIPERDFLVIGGDLNTQSFQDRALAELAAIVIVPPASQVPRDQEGRTGTNTTRKKPLDLVLADRDFQPFETAVVIGRNRFPHGLVFDSRVFKPLSDVTPVQPTDSGAPQMQHMAIVRDFAVPAN